MMLYSILVYSSILYWLGCSPPPSLKRWDAYLHLLKGDGDAHLHHLKRAGDAHLHTSREGRSVYIHHLKLRLPDIKIFRSNRREIVANVSPKTRG